MATVALALGGTANAEIVSYSATLTVSVKGTPGAINPPAQTYVISGSGTTDLTSGGAFVIPPGEVAGVVRSPAVPGAMFPGNTPMQPGFPLQSFFFGLPATPYGFAGAPATIQGAFGPAQGPAGGFGGFNPLGGAARVVMNLGSPNAVPGSGMWLPLPYCQNAAPLPSCPCVGAFTRPIAAVGGSVGVSGSFLKLYAHQCSASPGYTTFSAALAVYGDGWTTGVVSTLGPMSTTPLGYTYATGNALNTTVSGARTIQLVTPIRISSILNEQVGSARLKVSFLPIASVPAIGPWGLVAMGLSLLAGGMGVVRAGQRRRGRG